MVKGSCNIESFTTFYCGKKVVTHMRGHSQHLSQTLELLVKYHQMKVLILNGENDTQTPGCSIKEYLQ
jgi:hypothetical protein